MKMPSMPITVLLIMVIMEIVALHLKIGGYIHWSWWWISAPIWLPVSGFVSLIMLLCTLAAIVDKRDARQERERQRELLHIQTYED